MGDETVNASGSQEPDLLPANQVNSDRLWSRLMAMAEVAPTDNGGSNRQALSDDDAAGRALFLGWATAAGCSYELDEIGNLFVRRAGRNADAPAVLVGSHLDTQPTGGRFDGVYGVLGGLEVLERLNDLGVETERPIDLVVWTNEEGSRPSFMERTPCRQAGSSSSCIRAAHRTGAHS